MPNIANMLIDSPTYSYEFFPPKTPEQADNLGITINELAGTKPDFVSVTCGALGSPQQYTKDLVVELTDANTTAMPHVTCVGQSLSELGAITREYSDKGVENILALRGDGEQRGDFAHAIDLVQAVKTAHPHLGVGVAAHPEVHPASADRGSDRQHLAAKLEAADFAITQFFFDADHYRRLIEELDALECRKPVIPGIMLFTSVNGLYRIAGLNNTSIPSELAEQLDRHSGPADVGKIAVETAAALIDDLSTEEVPGLHVFTLNKSQSALQLHSMLGR
jgi:methylenetetrahydrofolate reductase (NADPH)